MKRAGCCWFGMVWLLLGFASKPAPAQVTAELGPRGEVTRLSDGGVVAIENLGFSLIKPGWGGKLVEQASLDRATVTATGPMDARVFTGLIRAGGCAIRFREAATIAPTGVSLSYELTPDRDLDTEVVLLEGLLPADRYAGKSQYLVAGDTVGRGVFPARLNRDAYVMVGGRPAEWVGFVLDGGPSLRLDTQGLDVQIQDNRRWDTPGFGVLVMAGGGRLRAGHPIRFKVTIAAESGGRLLADAQARERAGLAGVKLADDRPLAIRSATVDRQTLPALSTVELSVDLTATYDNPFDSDQIAVDAEVTQLDGTGLTVPGFYYLPMRQETHRGGEKMAPGGTAGFRVRYTPTVAGKHRIVVRVKNHGGTVRSAPIEITATTSDAPGFVRVARDSPRYFALDSGRPFFAVGENICWAQGRSPLADYAAWLKGLGQAGGNWARLWLSNNEKGLEWTAAPTPRPGAGDYPGLGRYSLGNAARLDEVMRLARENGVFLMFCLGTYGEFTEGGFFNEGSWGSNPYNRKNGGPCTRPDEFWTNPEARRLYQRKLRYLVARWAADPNLFAWEFWNEVPETPATTAWVAEMASYLKHHDPYRHLVSTTYGTARTWKIPEIDFTMTHMYGEAGNTADFTDRVARETHDLTALKKPYLLAEFGIDWQKGDERWDTHRSGLNMHNGAWAAMMSGAAGTAMLWWWDGYVHPANLYHVLTPVQKFADSVDWSRSRFQPIQGIRLEQAKDQPETFTDLEIPATLEWGQPRSTTYTVQRDGTLQGGPVAMTIGSPARANPGELPTRLTWNLDLPRACTVTARLGEVCSGARLRITVDGAVRVDRNLAAGAPGTGPWKSARFLEPWKVWVSDYAEDIAIDVPSGRHELSFTNGAGDWLQIRSLKLPGYRSSRHPAMDVLGLSADHQILLWFHNQESTWRNEHDGKAPRVLKGVRARVPASDGDWHVEWWDTFQGKVIRSDTAKASNHELVIAAPDLATDVAAKLERATASASTSAR